MISKDYKQNKAQVLSLFDDFKEACAKADVKVDPSIQQQADTIRNEVFNLMILGEAKSGKSTFINAYLGKEVVPMDVRQCTSAIIKIRKGETLKLVAKTAGGGQTTVVGEKGVKDFLKEHAAISDEYRNIPVTTINNELLIKYHNRPIPSHMMKTFLEAEAKDNIFNMNIGEYNKLIIKYITENASKWEKIITEIEITYPLHDAMQGITIIDSPGVGAGGNVGIIAENYISKANAIIFVKSLSGQALESASFMNFLRTKCTDRKKEMLFLVLTGKSNLQGSEFMSLKEQAIEMYRNDIKEEKIICVDSKMQLFLNKCRELGTEEAIDAYFEELDNEQNDFPPASKCWLKSKSLSLFYEKMEEISNFGNVQATLEKFARGANYLQLIAFLDNMLQEYSRYYQNFSTAINLAKENIDDPIALAYQIEEKRNEIADVYNKINCGIDEIYKKYTDNIFGDGIIMEEAEKKRAAYEEKLENFLNLPEEKIKPETFDSLKKVTMDAIDDTKSFRREMADRVIRECNEKLIQYTDDPSQIQAEAYTPNFTETDFAAINEDAKEKTSGYDEVEHGLTFTRVEQVPYHHMQKHVNLVSKSISDRLDKEIIPKMIDNVVMYVSNCRDIYAEKLKEHKQELDIEYQKLLEDKDNNEKQRQNITVLEDKISMIEQAKKTIIELKGELENYVTD